MSVKQKYLKDENGEIFSPIVGINSVYNEDGNDLSPQAITISFEGDVTVEMAGTYYKQQIPFSANYNQIGNQLTHTNNSIYVGKGIKYIEISGQINLWTGVESNECIFVIEIERNGSQYQSFEANIHRTANHLMPIPIPPLITQVKEGDYIRGYINTSEAGSQRIMGRNHFSYITAKKIY